VKEALDPLMSGLFENTKDDADIAAHLSALREDLDKTIIDQMADEKASENSR